jgi:sulfur carrier protein
MRQTMQILVNGAQTEVAAGTTLQDLLVTLQLAEARLALECNQLIIPRSQHASHVLQEGDVIEIVHAIGGG